MRLVQYSIKVFIIMLVCSQWLLAQESPLDIIKSKDKELQALLKQPKKNTDSLKVLINSIFDFEELGRKALPKSTYTELSPEQMQEFTTEFRRMVENSSVKKLELYENDSTVYEADVKKSDKAVVTAHVWNKGKESILDYKMHKNENGQWLAWDLVIDDLSTMRNYRDMFAEILAEKDFAGLVQTIKEKADEHAE
jgi:phospholipid transport system substrate-binding protein